MFCFDGSLTHAITCITWPEENVLELDLDHKNYHTNNTH